MIIRKAEKDDFGQVFGLELEYARHNNNLAKYNGLKYALSKGERKKRFLKSITLKNKLFLVMEDDSRLKGFLIGNIEKMDLNGFRFKMKKIGYLENVFIKEKYRRKGNFSELMGRFADFLKANKVKYCALHVDENNKAAIRAYELWSFRTVEYKMIAELR